MLGDITSIACIADDAHGRARFVARAEGVLAGTALATRLPSGRREVEVQLARRTTATRSKPATSSASVEGSLRSILTGERVALNFSCHCSGVASITRRYVRATHGKARILDTRKTLPGLRAVREGRGARRRRLQPSRSLSDAVLIKDNHLAGIGRREAVERARARWPSRIIEVECDSLEQVAEARDRRRRHRAARQHDVPTRSREAVALLDGSAKIEVSGDVTRRDGRRVRGDRRRLHLGRRDHALGAACSTSVSTSSLTEG